MAVSCRTKLTARKTAAQLRQSTRRLRQRSELDRPCGKPRPARARPVLASYSSPTGPALRANPFPEVTDPICRLPLPTLFYRLEAVHLGDLLRMWVRSGTKVTMPPSDFQGPTEVHRTPQEPRCFTGTTSLSPGKPIPGSPSLTKKRELFPGLPPTSPSSFALPHMARKDQTPMPGSGILTRFPFDRMRASSLLRRWMAPLRNGVFLSLRTD